MEFNPNFIEFVLSFGAGSLVGGGAIFAVMWEGIKSHYQPNSYCLGYRHAQEGKLSNPYSETT